MFENVKKALALQLRIDESKIQLDSKIKEDLGADSLDILQLLMTIEEDLGIVIPDESLTNISTVEDIVSFLESARK